MDKLGTTKLASDNSVRQNTNTMTDDELVKELSKLGSDMPESQAGQKTDAMTTPMSTPTPPAVAAPVIADKPDTWNRKDTKVDDNFSKIEQTSVPGSNPSDLDTNQDPLAVMAAKIASVIEPILQQATGVNKSAANRMYGSMKDTDVFHGVKTMLAKEAGLGNIFNKKNAMGVSAGLGVAGLGGVLGYMKGKDDGSEDNEEENQAIFNLGAEVGGRMVADNIMAQLSQVSGEEQNNGQ